MIRQSFEGIRNQTLPSLHGWSVEITITAPLMSIDLLGMNIERMIDRIEPMSTQLHIDRLQTKRSQVIKKISGN